MKRELARKGKRPRVLIFGLTETQKSQKEYYEEEINRLNAEKEELTRRHNMELEERDRRIEDLTRRLAQLTALETLRNHVILTCPSKLEIITIVQCRARLDRRDCMKKNCLARTMLLASL